MWCPEPVTFLENWWIEPLEGPGDQEIYVLQSADGAERLVVTVDRPTQALGLRRQLGTVWLDQVWLTGLERAWFDEGDGRLYARGLGMSVWVQKDPRPSFKVTAGGLAVT